MCPFGVSHEELAIVSIRSKSLGDGYCVHSDKSRGGGYCVHSEYVMRRWLLCPFGVSHEEVAIVSLRSKS